MDFFVIICSSLSFRSLAFSLSTYAFSLLSTTLPHKLINDKLLDLIERIFLKQNFLNLACNEKYSFTSEDYKHDTIWSCQKFMRRFRFILIISLLALVQNYNF